LRRTVVILTTLAMLVGATAASAATNTYAGTNFGSFKGGAGTKKKPVGVSFKQTLVAKNNDPSKVAAVLTHITTRVYGLVSNAKSFPTCDGTQMAPRHSDAFCPAKSKFATGLVHSFLGHKDLLVSNATACNPNLDVFNAGKNKLWFFFTTHSALQCNGLTTGATAAYTGTVSNKGGFQVLDIPLPPDISTKTANVPGLYASLVKEQLNWLKVSTKVKGKTVYNNVSTGCKSGKRPWSVTYTSITPSTGAKETQTVNGSAPC
jgi:hypothetical protein